MRRHLARQTLCLFFALIAVFLIVPWCFAVPPLSLFLVPLLAKVLRMIYGAGR